MSASLSKRVSELEASLVLLEKMQTYLRYEQTPTDELIEKLATLELFGSLRFLTECRRDMGKGTPFPQAWRAGVNRAKGAMHLSDKDLEAVRGISQIIGMSDAQGQISALDVTQDMLRDSLQEARQKKIPMAGYIVPWGFCPGWESESSCFNPVGADGAYKKGRK